MLITKDAELVKRMNAVRSPFVRSIWYSALRLHPTRDNITSVIDEGVHADIRNRMATGYSGKENLHMEQDIDVRLLQLYDLIESKYLSTDKDFRPMDLSKTLSYFTLDVISTVAFGVPFGFIEADDDPFGYIDNLQEFLPAIIVFGAYPELQKILRFPLFAAFMPSSADKRGLGRVMGFAKERVDERFGEKPIVRKDMLGSFIKRGLSQEELESETLTQITAGSDSTASALRMTLHFITTTPSVQAKLLSEFHSASAAGLITRPVIRDAEARKLPYLQACIKEGLRMYPPVTGLLAKAVPPEGATIDGKFVKGGTQIAWNSWGIMRDTEVFGVDSELFRPERWLSKDGSESEQKRVERMTETVGLVFGYGRFGCLGRGVAMQELNKGIIEVCGVGEPWRNCFPACSTDSIADPCAIRASARQSLETLRRALRWILLAHRHDVPHHEALRKRHPRSDRRICVWRCCCTAGCAGRVVMRQTRHGTIFAHILLSSEVSLRGRGLRDDLIWRSKRPSVVLYSRRYKAV